MFVEERGIFAEGEVGRGSGTTAVHGRLERGRDGRGHDVPDAAREEEPAEERRGQVRVVSWVGGSVYAVFGR